MKKLLSITLCILMIFGLAACGSNNGQQNDTSSATEQAAQETPTSAESEEPSDTCLLYTSLSVSVIPG